jgi:hypothetical protein
MRGQITAFYLFDVAESMDLASVAALMKGAAAPARFEPKPAVPPYVQYHQAPLHLDADALGLPPIDEWQARFKAFEYGVVSLSLVRPFSGDWPAWIAVSSQLTADPAVEQTAERYCRALLDRIHSALTHPRERFLSEDYFVFALTHLDPPVTAEEMLAGASGQLVQLLRGEREPLSTQERDEVVRHRLSYLPTDLVIPTWSTAFVYDTPAGVQTALEIIEYANSQLLQFRYYDELLDGELARIYKELESSRAYKSWLPRRYSAAARQVHALFIDVTELTDRTENALKLVGDVYAARLLALANSRLGVTAWRDSVHEKLKTLDEIYRFAVEQTGMERGELLELAIVAILIFELVLFFMGIMT